MSKYENNRKSKKIKGIRWRKKTFRRLVFFDILLVLSLVTILVTMITLICYLKYISEQDYTKGYEKGYSKGCTLGYEAAYPEVYESGYWAGFLEGCKQTSEEGFGRKNEIIDAYYSLLKNADLQETQQIVFTYRFRQLLRAPVPKEEDAEKFISDIEEILSLDT